MVEKWPSKPGSWVRLLPAFTIFSPNLPICVNECPCAPSSPVTPQSFVGNDYFCESGCPGQFKLGVLYTDPLWDGKQCGLIEKPCCLAPGIPWFHKTFNLPTTDYIELRVCANQETPNEDIPVGFYDIYVK